MKYLTYTSISAMMKALLNKQRKTKVNKKQITKKTNKLVNWAVVITLTAIVLGAASQGVAQYIGGMNEQQKLLAAVFVVSLMSYIIFSKLKNILK